MENDRLDDPGGPRANMDAAVEFAIRRAVADDAPAIRRGDSRVAETPGLLNALPGEIPESVYRETIESLQRSRRGLYVVAELGHEIVGHLLLNPMPLAANAHVCRLNIVVYPGRQGQGIGRRLLEHAYEWARREPQGLASSSRRATHVDPIIALRAE